MSVIGSNILAGASGQGGGYNLTRSLRFRSSASAFLNRTPASITSRTTWTWSGWVKRGALGTLQNIFSAGTASTDRNLIRFVDSLDTLQVFLIRGGSTVYFLETTQVFRDPSAWYHIVITLDTTNATSTDRVRLYINGSRVTSFGTATYPSLSYAGGLINTTDQHTIARNPFNAAEYFDGYMTEVNFIDGQALAPSSFGQTSTTTGVWQPKRYAGTYGTNGFYLPFTNNSTTTTLGNDFSGNGNNWTTNNISLTAGATYDSMTDVPTLTSATASNFCVLNPLDQNASTISAGNLNAVIATNASPNGMYVSATIGAISGKYYWETTYSSGSSELSVGVIDASSTFNTTIFGSGVGYFALNGNKYINGSSTSYGSTYTSNDVIGVALDMDAGTITFYKNGTSQGAVTLPTGVSAWKPSFSNGTRSASQTFVANFGQRPFAYTPPTGFVALNTFNLPTPTIGATASTQANKYFDIATYNNATVVSGLGFAPDLVWHKSRNQAYSHYLYDKLRGVGAKGLNSNSTASEGTNDALGIVSFDSTGVTYSSDAGLSQTNAVGWFWKANGTGVSNTAGSITSTVSANTTSGFSVVTYTGTQVAGTIGHGLGVAPSMIIVKARSNGVYSWAVYHATQGANKYLLLNSTAAVDTGTTTWNNTSPTSTVFSVGADVGTNKSGDTYVAYCFSAVAGYSAFGSYVGNGSTDGSFIYVGFKPRFVMIKRTDSGNNWFILDTARDTFNLANDQLLPNSSAAESTGSDCNIDILSNGFKLRTALDASNGSGGSYVYACFAEHPFKYSLGR